MLHSAGNNRQLNDNIASEIVVIRNKLDTQHKTIFDFDSMQSKACKQQNEVRGGPLVGTARVPTGVFHCAERFTCIPSLASSVMWRVYRYKTPYV